MIEDGTIEAPIDIELVKEKIYIIRGQKVMLDRDLAILYQVPTKQINRAVRRNLDRFPADFMFELTKDEMKNWKYQIGTSNSTLKQSLRKPPLAFTEQGIAMLSSVLNSKRAIHVNIQIIRIFTKLGYMIDAYKELREKVEEMEKNSESNFREIFRVLRAILDEEEKPKSKIGFKPQ
jgi:hypothetical protein